MTQKQPTALDRVVDLFANRKAGELEQVENLLQGVIAQVEPRRDFRKELGERLSQQNQDSPVVIERSPKPRADLSLRESPPSGFSWLITGIVGGLILIVMAVRLLIYFNGRNRSPLV